TQLNQITSNAATLNILKQIKCSQFTDWRIYRKIKSRKTQNLSIFFIDKYLSIFLFKHRTPQGGSLFYTQLIENLWFNDILIAFMPALYMHLSNRQDIVLGGKSNHYFQALFLIM